MKLPISAIILTYNEELNLDRCLKSIKDWVSEIFIVDSYSTDGTAQIVKRYGAKIVEHSFENQAQQFNWALDNLDIKSNWILRLDADEYLTEELKKEITEIFENLRMSDVLNIDGDNLGTSDVQKSSDVKKLEINGFYIKRRVYFMGRWIKHGGYYPTWILRLFRKGRARSEEREMDEHIILLEGRAGYLKNDFIDNNKKDLTFWVDKHNRFSSREVKEILKESKTTQGLEGPVVLRRLAKERYYKLPIFLRAFVYFLNRYFLRLGFLDGKEGLIFHFLQGFWYRFLIDAKIYEITTKTKTKP